MLYEENKRDVMSDEEFIQEMIWDKLQIGEYVEVDGRVYDYETGELICTMDIFT